MIHSLTKPTKWHVTNSEDLDQSAHTEDSDQSAHMHSLISVFGFPQWVGKDPRFLHVDSED